MPNRDYSQNRLKRISADTLQLTLPPEKPITYDIVIGQGLFPRIAQDLKNQKPASRYVIITDSKVQQLGYSEQLERELKAQGLSVETFTFPEGEKSKNTYEVNRLHEKLGEGAYNRDTMILALGGGVTGDMAGFVSATYLRGIPFVEIPTTTLSQADSGIGGKKGVDLKVGKNLVGAFAHCWRGYFDIDTLRTLDERNFRSGLIEGVKQGVIADREHFEFFEKYLDRILKREYESLRIMTERNCDIKGRVIQLDPKEKGLRKILNYGHTLGHAVETASNYQLLHGEAVAIGMAFAGTLAHEAGDFPLDELTRQNKLLQALGMNLAIPITITNEQLFKIMGVDKKAAAGKIRFCLPKEIGEMEEFEGQYVNPVDKETIEEVIFKCRQF